MDVATVGQQAPELKVCTACGVAQPFSEFFPQHGRNRLRSTCKTCGKEYYRSWYHKRTVALNLARAAMRKKRSDLEREEMEANGRTCLSCMECKPLEKFHKHKSYFRGYKRVCKECDARTKKQRRALEDKEVLRRKSKIGHLKKEYGLSLEEFETKIKQQGNRCAICDKEFNLEGRYAGPYVDHNHNTGAVRDLLCFECNSGLGRFKDDAALVKRALLYLERHGENGQPSGRGESRIGPSGRSVSCDLAEPPCPTTQCGSGS